jgi:hypothetical protein
MKCPSPVFGHHKLLIPEQAVVLDTDPDEARRIARDHMQLVLQTPNYVTPAKLNPWPQSIHRSSNSLARRRSLSPGV